MSKNSWLLILHLVLLSLLGCKEEAKHELRFRQGMVEKTSKDFIIPRSLREEIEKKYSQYVRQKNPSLVLPDEDLLARIPREFLDIKMRFRTISVLTMESHVEFNFPRGGGEIDLSRYIIGDKGSFFMKVDARRSDKPEEKLDNLLIYFLSNTKQLEFDGNKFGSGCGAYMDVTQRFQDFNAGDGLQLNATKGRYVPVVGGVFYFVSFSADRKIYLASARIINKKYPDYYCKEVY